MRLFVCFSAALFAVVSPSISLAQSAADDALDVLATIGDLQNIDGRWIWANQTGLLDLNKRGIDRLKEKMAQFCADDRSPVMRIERSEDGFTVGVIDAPPALVWQYKRDNYGAYTQSIDVDAFYKALGYSSERPPSESIVATNERNVGPVTVIRPDPDILLITHRNGFDLYARCDD